MLVVMDAHADAEQIARVCRAIEEWLMAAEYIVSSGNPNVILCERGIRTFETYTRNTLDLSAVPLLHHLTHLPVIVDPSHATGKRWLVRPLAIGGVAVGADGVMVEVHHDPSFALCDGEQALVPETFRAMVGQIERIALAIERPLAKTAQGATSIESCIDETRSSTYSS